MQINIIEYFEKTVLALPDKTAIVENDSEIKFKELRDDALYLADLILEKTGDQINQPIGVFFPKSINSVISDLAITYSGNIYMNLDVKSPLERIKNITQLVKPLLIITDKDGVIKLKDIIETALINIEEINCRKSSEVSSDLVTRLDERIIDTDPYCIINTSGSTGTPKGVVLNHKSFIDFTEEAQRIFSFSCDEIIGSLSPIVFDIYSYELCLLMSRGSTMVLIPEQFAMFPLKILQLINEQKVTFCFWVPTVMVNIANMDLLNGFYMPSLKLIWFAGEVFPTKQFNYWRNKMPQTKFANLYGPIEITLDCTYFIIDRELSDEEPIPIGHPFRNTNVLILNSKNEQVRAGEEGELCVRGTSLAMGYYNNSDKTSLAFVQNPLNKSYPETIYRTGDIVYQNEMDEIIFKGRKDSLIKHMGYRIELGEIEHVIINTLKLVDNGCVVYNVAKKEITLVYESKSDVQIAEIRKSIGGVFPKYMIPTAYIKMDQLPRNTNGKIDRLSLTNMVNGDGK